MPAGSTDANGVYQYGSSDTNATFHGLLNIANVVLSATIGAIKTRLTSVETSRDNPTVYVAGSSAARDSHWGSPSTATTRRALQDSGAITVRTDLGYTEQYFAGLTDGGTNPGGRSVAGWYPVAGAAAPVTVTAANAVTVTGLKARKINNRVFIEGTVSRASDITAALVGGTLPAGARPSADVLCAAVSMTSGFTPSFCGVIVTAGGDIQLNAPIAAAASSRYVAINMSFEAA